MFESAADRRAAGRTTLLERARHLALLEEAIASVEDRGRGQLLLVGGEGGVGKTALVRQFCAGRRRVLWGGCDALFTPRPLGPFLDIADATGGELEQLLDTGAKPYQVAACMIRMVAAQGPTIVVLEDLHWADEATLDVLRLLARPIEKAPALVIATYRNDQLDRLHPLRLVLGELRAGDAIRRLDVEPLSREAVERLASQSGVDGSALYFTTGGNPFFVTEALAAEAGTIPGTIRDAVLGHAARLSDAARVVLDAVAVVPPQAELWLLEALAGDAAESLDHCLTGGLLAPVPGGIAFRHELARRTVEESLPPQQRTALHRKALTALIAPPSGSPDLARLAHHAEAAGDGAAVLRYAPAAALHAASLGAHREAAAQYARALRFAASAAADVRGGLLETLSHEYYLTDQMEDAIDAMEGALTCRRELGDRRGQAAALCALSRRLWCAGKEPQAEKTGREALALLEGLPPGRELAMAYGTLSNLASCAEDADEVIFWGTRALTLGEDLGDAEIVVDALNSMGVMELLAGSGTAKLERGLELAERAGLDDQLGCVFCTLTGGITRTRSYGLVHWFDDGISACTQRGLDLWRLYVLAHRARFDFDQGRWSEATDAAAEILRYPRSSLNLRILALTTIGRIRARRGDPGHWEPIDEAAAIAQESHYLQRIAPVALARAEAVWLEGRPIGEMIEATQEALDLALARQAGWVIGELMLWRWLVGVDEPVPAEVAEPFALQLRGDWARAAARWTELGCPYEAALALGTADDNDSLRHALNQFRQLGSRSAAAIVARRLRERGVSNLPRGPRPATQANPAHLTSRELGVLGLVAQGLPNTQIAERLFLSTKTVDKHVSAALRKLGARSRAEASAEAVRLGIAESERIH